MDVFPTPAGAGAPVTLSCDSPTAATMRAEVLDELGRPVAALAQVLAAGPRALVLPIQGLAAGLYTVRLVRNGAAVYRKLLEE